MPELFENLPLENLTYQQVSTNSVEKPCLWKIIEIFDINEI
jgi:hypothetical protein